MLFNQGIFWAFFIIFLLVYYCVPNKYRTTALIIGNTVFCLFHSVFSMIMLIIVSSISFWGAIAIKRCESKSKSKRLLIGEIVVLVIALFALKNLSVFKDVISVSNIIVPLGISFYIIRAIGYLVDVYHGEEAFVKWYEYYVVLSYFPILPSGPIERESALFQEIIKEKRFEINNLLEGLKIFFAGLFMKIVLADRLAIIVNNVYGNYANYAGVICLLSVFMYSIQIYCDFGGYSYMAIGISKMLGINLKDNFKRPYLAESIKDFWRRWHISFSSWLRDYIYIPLGGSRKGKIRHSVNIVITFIVSGFWHGTGFGFLVWGGLHGIYQVIENRFKLAVSTKEKGTLRKTLCVIGTFLLVSFAWIFFRFDKVTDAIAFLGHIVTDFSPMVIFSGALYEMGWGRMQVCGILLACVMMICVEILSEKKLISLDIISRKNIIIRWIIYYIVLFWIVIAYVQLYGMMQEANFIYVNF